MCRYIRIRIIALSACFKTNSSYRKRTYSFAILVSLYVRDNLILLQLKLVVALESLFSQTSKHKQKWRAAVLCLWQARLAAAARNHYALGLPIRIRQFVCYQTFKHDGTLKTNEPILLAIGTSGTQGRGMKLPTLEVRRLKVKVTRDRNR